MSAGEITQEAIDEFVAVRFARRSDFRAPPPPLFSSLSHPTTPTRRS